MNNLITLANQSAQTYRDRWSANTATLNPINDNLKAYYRFDQNNIIVDSHGRNTLTDHNMDEISFGKSGYGCAAGSTTDYLQRDLSTGTIPTTYPVSFSFWLARTATSGTGLYVATLYGSNNYAFIISYDSVNNELDFNISNGASKYVGPMDYGWYHVVLCIDKASGDTHGRVYFSINGVYELEYLGDAINQPFSIFTVGNIKDGTNASPFLIDEISIWNKVLSEAECQALYNSGTGSFYIG